MPQFLHCRKTDFFKKKLELSHFNSLALTYRIVEQMMNFDKGKLIGQFKLNHNISKYRNLQRKTICYKRPIQQKCYWKMAGKIIA